MSFLGSSGTRTIDPYKYWMKHGGFGGFQAQNALMQMLKGSLEPGRSPEYLMGKQVIDEGFAANRQSMARALAQRGTAFGGQARRAWRDIDANRQRAYSDLALRLAARRPQLAQALASYASSMKMAPIVTQRYKPGLVDKMKGIEDFTGSIVGTLGNIGKLGGMFTGMGGGGFPTAQPGVPLQSGQIYNMPGQGGFDIKKLLSLLGGM